MLHIVKICTKCELPKDDGPNGDFYKASGGGLRSRCKVCTNEENCARAAADPAKHTARSRAWRDAHPGRASAIARAWQLRNPEQYKNIQIKRRFKIDFDAAWKAQDGKCASCGDPMAPKGKEPDSVCVDHDRSCCPGGESCGKCVRGLIHRNCNLVLGYAKDNPEVLLRAVEYLRKWQENSGQDPFMSDQDQTLKELTHGCQVPVPR